MQFICKSNLQSTTVMFGKSESTVLFNEMESTGNKHNLGKNLSNQFGSTLTLTHLAKEQWDKSISPKGTKVEQKCSKSNVNANVN